MYSWLHLVAAVYMYGKKKKSYTSKNIQNKFYLTGLGYKVFFFRKKLFILVGFSHYIIMHVPFNVKIVV
jgi:hypothetical protein